ncbi:ArpU family phage packaging/lysis transcriptional regulator [Parafrankia elaeagni]|uniref:ArpU family phage packaging/lysis transcriptional regulator n=1 Tax=Parafrankia elaeagni TaxID=222534 RepID=UPI00035D97B0|nr:ArpU family phage packaging/lysis transcriptional regulator [Parafrankia elaeagni]
MKTSRKLVESALEKYRMYLLTIPEYKLPKITATYTFVPKGTSDPSYSGIEKAVIEKVDYERERLEYITLIQKAVNRLNSKERQLIIRRYKMDEDEDAFDYEIYNDMGVSESHYYKVKRKALDKLAIILGITNDI